MRLHLLSDLHLEHAPLTLPEVAADVTILAGDIHRGTDGVVWARSALPDRPVLYLAGNHEFYGHGIPTLMSDLKDAAAGTGVHVLDNDELILDGARFLGATLWSDFDFDGVENRGRSLEICTRLVNDYKHIHFAPADRLLTPSDTRAIHLETRRWLRERLADHHDGPTVVLTHHAPLIRRRPEQSVLRALAGAFASDLSELMGADRAAVWAFGHTHRATDTDERGTRVISNPRGYPNQPVAEFDPGCVVEL